MRRLLGCSLSALVLLALGVFLLFRAPAVAIELGGGTELVYSVDGSLKPAQTAVQRRLRGLGMHGVTVGAVGTDALSIKVGAVSNTEAFVITQTLEMQGTLDFKLVALDPTDDDIEYVRSRKSAGKWLPYVSDESSFDRFDLGVDKATGKTVLLENKGVPGSLLKDAHRALDSGGRPAVGFTFGPEGRNRFYDLTSTHVNRQIAIVLDGVIQSMPTIRSAIGESGIIEGGQNGFTADEVKRIIVVLNAGSLPARLKLIQTNTVAASPGRAFGQLAGALGLSVVLLAGTLALMLRGQPTTREEEKT